MADSEGQGTEQHQVVPVELTDSSSSSVSMEEAMEDRLLYLNVAPVVFFRLKQTTRPRNWCLHLTCTPWLSYVSLLMVLLQCVSEGLFNPCEAENFTAEMLDYAVFVYFVMEALIKILALGLFGHRESYLRNNWKKFELFIICSEILDYFLASLGIYFKIGHLLKPMRLISRVPSILNLVRILRRTLPMLGNVFILYMFVVHIFGVVGVQLWAGQLRNRCFLDVNINAMYNVSLPPYFVPKNGERQPFICSLAENNGMRRCHDVPPLHEDGKTCSLAVPNHTSAANQSLPAVPEATAGTCVNWNMYYNVCRPEGQNPYRGAINFDNIGFAWIAIFQVVTLEGWTNIMYFTMDAYSFWSFSFFVFATIVCSSIVMNVCTVVTATHMSEAMGTDRSIEDGVPESFEVLCGMLTGWLMAIYFRCKGAPSSDSSEETGHITDEVWYPFQQKLKMVVESQLFDRVVMVTIILNIITMATEHHDQPQQLTQALYISNILFTTVFVVEMVLKQLALSWVYFADRGNIFDFVIVIISVWEIRKVDGKLSYLRAFRGLRFLKLVHFLPYLQRQMRVLMKTVREAATLCWLMLLVTFIFSVMGMHLFGCKFSFKSLDGETITERMNFDNLLWSMVTVFQILTQEDWNLVLYNAMAATTPWAAMYFVAIIVFGRQMLLNVLLGIVVDSYQSTGPTETVRDPAPEPGRADELDSSHDEDPAAIETLHDTGSMNFIHNMLRWCKDHKEWSLYMLSPENKFRVFCQCVVSLKVFEGLILTFILMSCITIAMERPGIHPESTEQRILDVSSYMFTVIFSVEMLLKVLANGLLFGTESYCRSPWNIMDGLLSIVSLIHISVKLATASQNNMLVVLKVLRLLRVLRPLRLVKRTPKLRRAVKALMTSVKPMGNIVLMSCIFLFLFGIIGVQLFKGKFFHCVGHDTRNVTNKTDCLAANYRWVRKTYNFDNLIQALMSLFVMYSKDGWVNLMYDGLDAVGVDQQPVKNHDLWMLVFFISFMVVSFFLLDMFIGVMVESFRQCQQQQRRREELEGRALQDQPTELVAYYTSYSPIRRYIHTLCTNKFMDLFVTGVIFTSVFIMSFEHYNQPAYVEVLTDLSHCVFTAILVTEVVLKVVAFGPVRFMKNRWYLLDVVIMLISLISIVFNELRKDAVPFNPNIFTVCRVLRLAQVLKAKNIRLLLNTIVNALSQVGSICLLFVFFFSIYAALGVELFGRIGCTYDCPCLGINPHANFRNFGMALLTLYKVCTGDNWNSILKDTMMECRAGHDGIMGWVSPIFFISFVVLAQFVMINLVVAAIMQSLDKNKEKEEQRSRVQAGMQEEQDTTSEV